MCWLDAGFAWVIPAASAKPARKVALSSEALHDLGFRGLLLMLPGGGPIVSSKRSFTTDSLARFVLRRALSAMRKWKIRTKMIAGLCGLAMVIGLLVYSSWSQLTRDRYLATEISQLAVEIDYSHALTGWAERLRRSHLLLQSIKNTEFQMIESDQYPGLEVLEELERSIIKSDAKHDIQLSLTTLRTKLDGYKNIVGQQTPSRRSTTLLTDRSKLGIELDEIDRCLGAAETEWSNAANFKQSILSIRDHNRHLKGHLDHLVDLTSKHFEATNTGMKQFRVNVRTEQKAMRKGFWAYTGLSAFLIVFLAWQFWTLIVVPFRTLFRGSQLIATGHHQHKILLGTNDEIGSMADTVNDITDRFNRAVSNVTLAKQRAEQEVRDRTREVIQNEQLASVGFLAAGVAHEINNPLGAIAWGAEALEETLNDLPEEDKKLLDQDFLAELQTNLGLIQSEAFRCKGITERLLNFSRLSDLTRDQEDLGELVGRVVSMVGKVGEYRCKTIQMHAEPKVMAHCNSQEIQQVVLNLVSNALESVDTDGKVDVHVRSEIDHLSGTKQAVVVVEDNGCGMDEEVMHHLFEPFFTRRRDDTGTGLGLSISYRIVSKHHGSLTPHSDGEGCGSRMVLRLPAEPAKKESSETTPSLLEHNQSNSSTKWNDVQKVA